MLILAIYCMHRLYLILIYNLHKDRKIKPIGKLKPLPFVTIQLPIYNEKYVVKRLIESACKINYPKEKFEIQILDDSTDETSEIVSQLTKKFSKLGFNICHIKRKNREGFKAGALQCGLKLAKGDFIAIFDADFIIPENFLLETIHYFKDPKVGLVQTCWDYINRDYSILTRVQALMLDAHFIIEHFSRNRDGKFFNFNGTAGIWRKKAIISAGGWSSDTLTEDLDLSYRAQLNGWKFIFLKDIKSFSELPVEINSFKQQQHRWTKGAVETFFKIFPKIVKSNLPLGVKIEAFFHLGGNFSYLFLLFLVIIMYPAIIVRLNYGWYQLLFTDIPLFFVSFFSIFLFYRKAIKEVNSKLHPFIYIPILMATCIGLSLNNAKAVVEAIFKIKTPFNRTPKFNVKSKSDKWFLKKYNVKINYLIIFELLMAGYFGYIVKFSILRHNFASIPFLMLFLTGFLLIFTTTVFHKFKMRNKG